MVNATAKLHHADGSKEEVKHLSHEITRSFGKKDIASVFTTRDSANSVQIVEQEDWVEIFRNGSYRWGGVLQDVKREKGTVELIVHGFEVYAEDSVPTPGDETWDNVADSEIIKQATDAVPQLDRGSINTVDNNVSFVFSHASNAYKMRSVEEATSGELFITANKEVVYQDKIGSDRTSEVTISPSQQNISDKFQVKTLGGDEKITHLRMIGAGEGPHQISVESVAPSYSSGDREIWRVYSNKSITDADTLQKQADALIQELNTENIEVTATIKDVHVNLGDEYYVEYPKKNIARDLRVVSLTQIVDSQGERYDTTLSSRQKTRKNPQTKSRQDVERYNRAVEGNAVPINAGGGRQPVNNNNNYEMRFYYPSETVYEHRLNVRVMGLEYRAYSEGAASGGNHTHTVNVYHPSHDHTVTHPEHEHTVEVQHPRHDHRVSGTTDQNTEFGNNLFSKDVGLSTLIREYWQTKATVSSNKETAMVFFFISIRNNENSGTADIRCSLDDGEDFIPDSAGVEVKVDHQTSNSILVPYAKDISTVGDIDVDLTADSNTSATIDVTAMGIGEHTHDVDDTSKKALGNTESTTSRNALGQNETSTTALGTTTSESSNASGGHTHAVEPGIIGTNDFPSSCDVIVNGQSMGTSFGDASGPFRESVDIRGQLNPGQVNTVEVTSNSLGHIQAYVEGDVYRQILGNG